MATVAEQLREQIDKQYQEAVAAFDIVARYLANSPTNGAATAGGDAPPEITPLYATGNFRDRVIAATRDGRRSIGEIAGLTGLDKKQIRGVVNAPALKDNFERETENEVTYYKFVATE